MVPHTMAKAGVEVLGSREAVEAVSFANATSPKAFNVLLRRAGEVHGAILGLTRFGDEECDGANGLQVVSRIGVGYDTVDVPALTRHRVPLMIAGTSN